ncbi:hypothetical protein HME9302_01935 [Alteripontixanthobacter maritimus]|uniref:Phosphatase n=1 Tax=Alteripontixanthobacter maritimus TaxID=2161824 RepID=A0A369Q8P9_9SPHN|nr:alkaline phosphatase PhoX [Alteripontixanthobacter maritimus]RDC60720.1 hypothetical protein HME9302_01935 [Alteripontixanthobacter maritimus]
MLYQNRRNFLAATGSAFAALATSSCIRPGAVAKSGAAAGTVRGQLTEGYGPLVKDPAGLLDLPEGFSYRLLSKLGQPMSDGGTVPDRADGMGCLDLGKGRIALVRNHELMPDHDGGGPIASGYGSLGGQVMPGGTTTMVLDARTLALESEFRSLAGTIRNCSGGVTPWGSWLSCEEAVIKPGDARDPGDLATTHGWVFEVPGAATGLVDAKPLKHLGRFNHEAASVDPATGIVYLSEDREDSLFYRFVPSVPGDLTAPGKLQAMAVEGVADSRNWTELTMRAGEPRPVRWIDMDEVHAPDDDLRTRGAAQGATLIARGEGLHMGVARDRGEVYLCSTSGGAKRLGQIFRLAIGGGRGKPDTFELFFESSSPDQMNYGDNLTVAPNGHVIVCEDQYTDTVTNHLIGVTPDGAPYRFGLLTQQTELAGGCFSPDGKWFFVNAYSPTATVAITGPWMA